MEINEMKQRILEKLKEGKPAAPKTQPIRPSLAAKMGIQDEDIMKIFEEPVKQKVMPKSEKGPAAKPGVSIEQAGIAKSLDEYKKRSAALEAENKNYKDVIAEKDETIAGLEKKMADEFGELKKEKTQTINNVESLRSKLYAAQKESKDLAGRISQLEDTVKSREKKLADIDRLYKDVETAKSAMTAKLSAIENEKKVLESKASQLGLDLETAERKLGESEKLYSKKLEVARNEVAMKLQSSEREKKDLEGKVSQLTLELEARDKRLEDTERSYKELDDAVREVTLKLQSAENDRKDAAQKLSQIKSELEASQKDLAESGNRYRDLESEKSEAILKLQAAERENKVLNGKVSQMALEIDAKTRRMEEAEKLYKELDDSARKSAQELQASEVEKKDLGEKLSAMSIEFDMISKKSDSEKAFLAANIARLQSETDTLKSTLKEREKREFDLNETISYLRSEIETRDKKIESDIKYYERVVKEINELRQKAKAYVAKPK